MKKLNSDGGPFAYKSRIDPTFTVFVVYKDDKQYKAIKKIIPDNDVAFTDLSTKVIIIDGEQLAQLSDDHLYFIENHEICHHLLGHQGAIANPEQEKEADLGAYIMLKRRGKNKAADLVKKFFKIRHNTNFKSYEDKHSDDIVKRLGL